MKHDTMYSSGANAVWSLLQGAHHKVAVRAMIHTKEIKQEESSMFDRKRRHFWFGEEWESPGVTLEVDKSSATFGAHFNFGGEKDFAVGLSAFGRSIWLSLHDAIPRSIRRSAEEAAKRKAAQLNEAAGRTVAYSY